MNSGQVKDDHLFCNENPLNSAIFAETLLVGNAKLKGYRKYVFAQCAHGLVNEDWLPIKKMTRLDANYKMYLVPIGCPGHWDQNGIELQHAILEGKDADGCVRTSKAAVYTRQLCRCIISDMLTSLIEADMTPQSKLHCQAVGTPSARRALLDGESCDAWLCSSCHSVDAGTSSCKDIECNMFFWACAKCRDASRTDVEHTRIPGQCRAAHP